MYRYIATFLTGALVPTVCIYLTGGSNRTNLVIGLVLGVLFVVVPVVRWRNQVARWLWAMDHGLQAFQSAASKVPARAPVTDEGAGHAAADKSVLSNPHPTPEIVPPNPMIGDVASALHNLGKPYKQALRIAQDVAAHQKYDSFEEMFKAAMGVANIQKAA
jgi:hypothetical protein